MLPSLDQLLQLVPAFIIAIAIHEASHALVATLLGDSTPRQQGRLTLNPLRHLDPMGTLLLFIAGFGWGKPVYVNPGQFRINPITGNALVALAGPASNVITAVAFALPMKVGLLPSLRTMMFTGGAGYSDLQLFVWSLFFTIISINVLLAVFNLIPLPPLDGFSVLMGLLPRRLAYAVAPIGRYGPAALLALFFIPSVLKINLLGPVLGPPRDALLRLIIGV